MRLSVIGLGKLGSPLAAVFASQGHQVIGVDVNAEGVRLLAGGKAPVQETRLQEVIDRARGRLTATLNCEDAVLGTDLTLVTVPTPSDETGRFASESVLAVVEQVGSALRKKPGYHVVGI